jgi:hypothetical protein
MVFYLFEGSLEDAPQTSSRGVMIVHPVVRMNSQNSDAGSRALTEWTPLIVPRRSLRSPSESIMNWKVISLMLLLIVGVLIGVHLLYDECK